MPSSDNPFRPFETHIDEARALAILRDAVAGGDDGELYLERRRSEVLSFDDGRLRTASGPWRARPRATHMPPSSANRP